MSLETLCPPMGDLPDRLKTANGLTEAAIRQKFGPPLEVVKTPSLDQLITRPEIGTIRVLNPQAVEIKQNPKTAKPEPALKAPEPIISPKIDPTKQVEYVDGPIFAFGVGTYKNLYNRYLDISEGNMELAMKYTRMAIINDSTSFIQEYYADAKDKNGQYIIENHVIRGELAHTPTKNEYIIKKNKAGETVICSPEQEPLDASITDFVSGFRRGADLAMMGLVQEIAPTLPSGKEGEVTSELLWSSPKSQEWEGYWINKYCSKYGYIYKGSRVLEEGKEKLVVYSYKVDSTAASHINFQQNLEGTTYEASSEGIKDQDKDENGNLREADIALRTLVVLDGPMRDEEVLSRSFQSKEKIERSKLMFKLEENILKQANNPFLREQIEKNVSTPVADWLLDQIVRNIPDEEIQPLVEGAFTDTLKSFFGENKKEKQAPEAPSYNRPLISQTSNYKPRELTGQDVMYAEAMRKRQEVGGGFCGDLGGEASPVFGTSSIVSSGTMSFSRSGGFARGVGGLSSGEVTHCRKCNEEICEGKCFKCNIKYK